MDMKSIPAMAGKKVCVTTGDIIYKGILIEVSEQYVELQGETQWITIPVESINLITLDE